MLLRDKWSVIYVCAHALYYMYIWAAVLIGEATFELITVDAALEIKLTSNGRCIEQGLETNLAVARF